MVRLEKRNGLLMRNKSKQKLRIYITIYLLLFVSITYADYPDPRDEYVNDFAGLVSDSLKKELRKRLYDVEYYSGVEISLVTITDYAQYQTKANSWEEFSTGLFNKWGIGNLPENNGVLFLISSGDRKVRIELGAGYPFHYDTIVQKIIDSDIVPYLSNDEYESGIRSGIDSIIDATTVEVSLLQWYKWYIVGAVLILISLGFAEYARRKDKKGVFWMLLGFAGIVLVALIKSVKEGERSEGFGGGSSRGGGGSGSF